MKTGILGGGLTGLSVGFLLKQRGIDFEILEKEKECGGLMRSVCEDGFTFDSGGSHIIFSKDRKAMDFLCNSLGKNIVKNRRNTKILFKNRLVKYPFENGLSDLPFIDRLECLKYFLETLSERHRKPENLKQWFYYTFGKGIAEKYLIPYNEKIWKYPPDKTSTEWVERIPNPPVEDIIKSFIGFETGGYSHQLYFYYPRSGGIEAIIKSLLSETEEKTRTGMEITGIEKKGSKWIVSASEKTMEYDRLVSTIPIDNLANYMKLPENVRKAIENLKYNSLISVMIGVSGEKISDLSWLYIPDPEIITHRISFPSNYSPCNSPEGTSSILAEITCRFGDDIWKMGDEEVTKRVVDDLEKLGILKKSEVCFSRVAKMKHAYVINDIEYRKNNEIVQDHFRKMGLILVGRFSEFKYLNMDGCVRSAMDFVEREFNK